MKCSFILLMYLFFSFYISPLIAMKEDKKMPFDLSWIKSIKEVPQDWKDINEKASKEDKDKIACLIESCTSSKRVVDTSPKGLLHRFISQKDIENLTFLFKIGIPAHAGGVWCSPCHNVRHTLLDFGSLSPVYIALALLDSGAMLVGKISDKGLVCCKKMQEQAEKNFYSTCVIENIKNKKNWFYYEKKNSYSLAQHKQLIAHPHAFGVGQQIKKEVLLFKKCFKTLILLKKCRPASLFGKLSKELIVLIAACDLPLINEVHFPFNDDAQRKIKNIHFSRAAFYWRNREEYIKDLTVPFAKNSLTPRYDEIEKVKSFSVDFLVGNCERLFDDHMKRLCLL